MTVRADLGPVPWIFGGAGDAQPPTRLAQAPPARSGFVVVAGMTSDSGLLLRLAGRRLDAARIHQDPRDRPNRDTTPGPVGGSGRLRASSAPPTTRGTGPHWVVVVWARYGSPPWTSWPGHWPMGAPRLCWRPATPTPTGCTPTAT